ncbi:MAG: hypothetical protein HY908_32205 [Myxococcales bacterium]|nr:hypothetical protein [Myxococcales bacterium]
MGKGLAVIAWVIAFVVTTWALRGVAWAPPALGSPEAFAALARPFTPRVPGGGGELDRVAGSGAGESPADLEALVELPAAQPAPGASAAGAEPLPSFADFLGRLRALERGERDKVRVAHLGDSELVGDGVSSALRDALSERFGSGGLGFGLAMSPFAWYARRGWEHREGRGFEARSFVFARPGEHGFGPGGVGFVAQGFGASAHVRLLGPGEIAPLVNGPAVPSPVGEPCTLGFHYWAEPGLGAAVLRLDGVEAARISFAAERARSAVHRLELERCPRKLEVETTGKGPHRVFGWSVERATPGIVWSSLGMISARLVHLENYGDDALAGALAGLEPDLLVVTYCLNFNEHGLPRDFVATATHALARLRAAAPRAACLVTGPYPVGPPATEHVDLPLRDVVESLDRAEREAALAVGCAYVDRIRLAGGIDAVKRWTAVRPALLSGDYRHLTPEGAERMGRALARVILGELDGHAAPGAADPGLEARRPRRRPAGD